MFCVISYIKARNFFPSGLGGKCRGWAIFRRFFKSHLKTKTCMTAIFIHSCSLRDRHAAAEWDLELSWLSAFTYLFTKITQGENFLHKQKLLLSVTGFLDTVDHLVFWTEHVSETKSLFILRWNGGDEYRQWLHQQELTSPDLSPADPTQDAPPTITQRMETHPPSVWNTRQQTKSRNSVTPATTYHHQNPQELVY